jgi:K+-sensing histidine kinase KdpD/putative methionine-R-sulfoxide reductase with GAF domain
MQQIGKALSSVLNRDRLLILIMEEVTKLIEAERGTLYIVDEEKGEIWSKIAQKAEIKEIRQKIGVGISGYVAKTGETINIKDAYRDKRFDPTTDKKTGYVTRSILCMPIREPVKNEQESGKIIAVLQLLNKIDGHFTDEDEDLLTSLSSQIAISLANSRLYSILEDRLSELDLMYTLEKELSGSAELDVLLQRLLDLLTKTLSAEHALMLLPEKDSDVFSGRYGVNLDMSRLREAKFSKTKGVIGKVLHSGDAYVANEAEKDDLVDRETGAFFGVNLNQILCAPMKTESDTLGIIELINKTSAGRYFSENDVKIIQSVASQVARGIETYRLKEEKMKADRLATIGNMMSTIVHDLRTPMNNIYGFVDLMLEEADSGTRQEYADIINEQIKILTNMTTDVLDFAKGKTTILPRKCAVDKLVNDFGRFFEEDIRRKGFEFESQINTSSMIYVDPEKINRVFMNIMKNALEAMGKKGKFSLIADEKNGEVIFRLKDTGPGIPEEIKDRLFDSFVTSGKEGGTGLGLAIVKKVIDEHKGRVEVVSEKGKGTTFNLYFKKQ